MNYHSFLDKISIWAGLPFLWNKKYFRRSIESPRVKDILNKIHLDFPEIEGEGVYEVGADSPVGKLDPEFKVKMNRGRKHPTIIYHHGNAEKPYDKGFNKIFSSKKGDLEANLIVVREPFQGSLKTYMEKLKDLKNFVCMLGATVRVTEEIINHYKCDCEFAVSGISLGGWVTNMHHAYYNTADHYIPLLAGAKLGNLFTDSIYRKITSKNALKEDTRIKNVLNFEEDFLTIKNNNVHPLMARYDQYIEYDVQKSCYRDIEINIIDKGHLTAASSYDILRKHILDKLR